MEATISMESILQMLSTLSKDNKKWIAERLIEEVGESIPKPRKRINPGLSDEELAAKLSQFPDWDETEHADLSNIDYSKCIPYQSEGSKRIIAKWL